MIRQLVVQVTKNRITIKRVLVDVDDTHARNTKVICKNQIQVQHVLYLGMVVKLPWLPFCEVEGLLRFARQNK